jgi:hypothetical protein
MWCQKLKVSCLVFFRAEGTIEPTTQMLSRESRANPVTCLDSTPRSHT